MTTETSIGRPASRQQRGDDATLAFDGKLFKVWQWQQQLFNGKFATFEQLSRPDTVLVLPITPNGDALLIEETQPGTGPMLRTIGGRIEPGERPESAARRELAEESGFEAVELRLWAAWQPVNKIDWAVYLFVAHGLNIPKSLNLDAGEKIGLHPIKVADLLNAPTVPALDDNEFLYQLNAARSDRAEWLRIKALLSP